MKKMLALFIILLFVTACTSDNEEFETVYIGEVYSELLSFEGRGIVSLRGFVAEDDRLSFRLTTTSGEKFIQVDYRGNQALPELGAEIIITGSITTSCCGLIMIMSNSYEIVGEAA